MRSLLNHSYVQCKNMMLKLGDIFDIKTADDFPYTVLDINDTHITYSIWFGNAGEEATTCVEPLSEFLPLELHVK